MESKELIQQTVKDLEDVRDALSERHKDNPTLSLRLGSVFTQLINGLAVHIGSVVSTTSASGGFTPQPLKMVLGKEIKTTSKLELKPIDVDEVAAFKEKIEMIYNGFLDRENIDLKDSLQEIEIRGVAKLAGVEDFHSQKVDGHFINKIKKAIQAKIDLEASQDAAKQKLEDDASGDGKTEDGKIEVDEVAEK